MSLSTAICPECGTALDSAGLGGMCPRCVALEVFTPQEEPPPAPGEQLLYFGDYELLEEVARGGMGVVFKARQVSLNRVVAVKMIAGGVLANDDAIARFKTEATAAASLQHPNIVAIHEIGEHGGQYYFSMDYVAGQTLGRLAREGPLPPDRAATYARRVAEAVHYAHSRGVLHRDLKPSNVLIDEQDQPRVTDFGVAKRLDADSTLTGTDAVMGTPAFMPPEQADRRHGAITARSDVYGLGAMLYHLATGRAPFTGASPTEILTQVLHNEPVAPRLLHPGLPRDLETICLKALEKEPSRRYPSAGELAEDLGRFLRDEPIQARPISAPERAWRWCRRKPALASALAACGVILVAGVAGILWQLQQTEAARAQEEAERRRAERSELATRENLYAADMLTVQHALDEGDLGTAQRLLELYRPKPGEKDLRGFEWRYYWTQAKGDQIATLNHSGKVTGLAFSPDGNILASASLEGVRLWDWREGRLLKEADSLPAYSVSFSADGRILLAGAETGTIWKWLWSTTARPEVLGTYPERQIRVVCAPRGTVAAIGLRDHSRHLGEGITILWDFARGAEVRALPESGYDAAFSPDGQSIATGGWRGLVKIWNIADGKQTGALTNPPNAKRVEGGVNALAFSSDGRTLAAAAWMDGVWLWDVASRKFAGALTGHASRVWNVSWAPQGPLLASCAADQTIRLWRTTDFKEAARFRGHSQLNSVAVSRDGRFIAGGGEGVKIWQIEHREKLSLDADIVPFRPVYSADSQRIACVMKDGSIAIWDLATNRKLTEFPSAGTPLGFSNDGREFASLNGTSNEFKVQRWDISSATVREAIPLKTGDGAAVVSSTPRRLLSPRGRFVTMGTKAGGIWLWDLSKNGALTLIPSHETEIFHLSFSADERLIASTAMRSTVVKLWETETGKPAGELLGHTEWFIHSVFSPNGRLIATGGSDVAIKVWDLESRTELFTLVGHREGITGVNFSPDGRTLVSCSDEPVVRLWELATRRHVGSISRERVYNLVFSPDGQTLAGTRGFTSPGVPVLLLWRAPGFEETDAPPAPDGK